MQRVRRKIGTASLQPANAVADWRRAMRLSPSLLVAAYIVAAGFSFLLGFVTLLAATLYKGYKSGPLIIHVFGWPNVILGIIVAAITASVSVRFFVGPPTRNRGDHHTSHTRRSRSGSSRTNENSFRMHPRFVSRGRPWGDRRVSVLSWPFRPKTAQTALLRWASGPPGSRLHSAW